MKIYHETGEVFRLDAIVELIDGIPARIFIRHEFRKIYKIKDKYWFQYRNHRYYLDIQIPESITGSYLKIHIAQCLKCRRLQSGINCRRPGGLIRYFKGSTNRNCGFFDKK